jgi:hypothetical protein
VTIIVGSNPAISSSVIGVIVGTIDDHHRRRCWLSEVGSRWEVEDGTLFQHFGAVLDETVETTEIIR